jgi:PTS system nitrogen regulatory IIA component
MLDIAEYTDLRYIKFVESTEKNSVLEELASVFNEGEVCTSRKQLIHALKERERMMSTGIGFGIAIPHAKIAQVKKLTFAMGISKNGIEFDSMDGKPVYLIILVAAGEDQHKQYLSIMSSIMTLLKDEITKEKIINSESTEEIFEIIKNS